MQPARTTDTNKSLPKGGLIALAFCISMGAGNVSQALEWEEAAHLLRRTGFAPTAAEVQAYLNHDREAAVELLLDGVATEPSQSPPSWATVDLGKHYQQVDKENKEWRTLPEKEATRLRNERRQRWQRWGKELKAWWMQEMLTTTSPLTERLLWLWHNHFTTELRVVQDPILIWEQHRLLRQFALDNFGKLSLAIPADPAMFRYLDSNSNVKGRPNENFAREVMELFTVGEGNYTEDDIKEAARAFTGYKINANTGRPELQENQHDLGVKRVLGHKGNFTGEEIIIKLLLKEEDVALNLAGKMWKEFIGPAPTDPKEKKAWDKEIYKIARVFYKSRYNIRPLVKATLMHDAFWDVKNRGVLIKSPAELCVGACRQLGIKMDAGKLVDMCSKLGQEPFNPPNVKGWHGHTAWVSTQSFMSRQESLHQLLGQRSKSKDHWLQQAQSNPAITDKAIDLLIAVKASSSQGGKTKDPAQLIVSALYHLK